MKKTILLFALCFIAICGCQKDSPVQPATEQNSSPFQNCRTVTLKDGTVLVYTKDAARTATRTAACSTPWGLNNLLYNGLVWFNWSANAGYSTLYINGVTNPCWQGWSLTGVGLPLSQVCGNVSWYVVHSYPPDTTQCISEASKCYYECPLPSGHGNNGHHHG